MQIILSFVLFLTCLTPLPMHVIYDFNPTANMRDWRIVNDDVMGGVSQSSYRINPEGMGVFRGKVSLENNGGFCSLRHPNISQNREGYDVISIRLKGDGKAYQFRIKAKSTDYYSYVAPFQTTGEWQTIDIRLDQMYPTFRGRRLNLPNFAASSFDEVAFLIGNKREESFEIQFDQIVLK